MLSTVQYKKQWRTTLLSFEGPNDIGEAENTVYYIVSLLYSTTKLQYCKHFCSSLNGDYCKAVASACAAFIEKKRGIYITNYSLIFRTIAVRKIKIHRFAMTAISFSFKIDYLFKLYQH